MKLTEEQLKALMQQQTAPRGRAECLTEEQFIQAAAGEMSQSEKIEMAHHMTRCADCAQEYRLIRSLRPWAEKAQTVASSESGDSHARLTVVPIRRAEEKSRKSAWPVLSARLSARSAALALAASVLIIFALGVWLLLSRQEQNRQIARLSQQLEEKDRALSQAQESLIQTSRELEEAARQAEESPSESREEELARREEEIIRLRQTVREITRPQIDVPIIDLDPSPVRSGGGEKASRVEVPESAGFLTLILNFSGEAYPRYEVEILDRHGRRVWGGQRSRNSGARSLNLTLSRRLIPEGQYLIKLYGLSDGAKGLVADYAVTINYQ